MNNYLIQIILFGSVYLTQVQSQANDTSTMLSSAMSSSTMISSSPSAPIASAPVSSPTVYSSSAAPISSPTVYSSSAAPVSSPTVYSSSAAPVSSPTAYSPSMGTLSSPTAYSSSMGTVVSSSSNTMSRISGGTSSYPFMSSSTIIQSSYTSTMIPNTSMRTFSSSYTSATTASITSAPITSLINTNITIAYKYVVVSSASLKPGVITNRTVLDSVQRMVISSFNLPNFIITVLQVEIISQSKATNNETNMIATNLFQSSRSNCDKNCITSAAVASTLTFQLPLIDGSLSNVTIKSAPVLPDDTTTATTSKYQNGERPPGLAAQLGMGLGITLISLLLIGEIVFLYRKYGLPGQTRQSDYQLPTYNH